MSESKWLPIETAPKDEQTPVYLKGENTESNLIFYRDYRKNRWWGRILKPMGFVCYAWEEKDEKITHWKQA